MWNLLWYIYATAIRNCDPEGPRVLYVSKMIPASYKCRFFAFVHVLPREGFYMYEGSDLGSVCPCTTGDLYIRSVQHTVIWIGRSKSQLKDIPCGNTDAMVGLDQFITKNATLTNGWDHIMPNQSNEVLYLPFCASLCSGQGCLWPTQSSWSFELWSTWQSLILWSM